MNTHIARAGILIAEEMPTDLGDVVTQLIAKCPEPDCDITLVTLRDRTDFGYNPDSTVIYHVMDGKAMHWRYESGKLHSQTLFPGDTVVVPQGTTYSMVPLEKAPTTFLTLSAPQFDSSRRVVIPIEAGSSARPNIH